MSKPYSWTTDNTDVCSNRKDCFCNQQFNVKSCSVQGIFKTADVIENDPTSISCPADTTNIMSEFPEDCSDDLIAKSCS